MRARDRRRRPDRRRDRRGPRDRAAPRAHARAQARRRARRRPRRRARRRARGRGADAARSSFAAWEAAFSERADGDLRVSARSAQARAAGGRCRRACSARSASAAAVVARQVHGAEVVAVARPPRGLRGRRRARPTASRRRCAGVAAARPRRRLPADRGRRRGRASRCCTAAGAGSPAGSSRRACARCARLGVRRRSSQAAIGPGVGRLLLRDRARRCASASRAYAASRGRLLDLKAVAAAQLREAGVERRRGRRRLHDLRDAGRLFSHRRDGAATGRQGGFAWLRAERRAGARRARRGARARRRRRGARRPRPGRRRDPRRRQVRRRRRHRDARRRRRHARRREPRRRTCSRRSRTPRGGCAGTSSARCSRARSA